MNADDFYALRDDRTNRCCPSPAYQSIACTVRIETDAASTATGQVMLMVACGLLSRWCRRITVVMPPCDLHADLGLGSRAVRPVLLAQMQDADPYGMFSVQDTETAPGDIVLCVGAGSRSGQGERAVYINASGWLASIALQSPSMAVPPGHGGNHLGAIAAACLGVAQVFKIAVGMPAEQLLRGGVFDLFRMAWTTEVEQAGWPADRSVGRILMVGAGSVGSSAAYCMRIAGLKGALTVVDQDPVKVENFNRSLLFGCSTYGLPKVEAITRWLKGSDLVVAPICTWWNEFLMTRGRTSFDFDVWLPLANEFNVRLSMQSNVPPLMIHASTTANWGINHARHIPLRDDCLADRFPESAAQTGLACSAAKVEVATDVVVDAALPFASTLAGLLITADLVRMLLPGYPQVPNFALLDLFGALDVIQAWDRQPRVACICHDQGPSFQTLFNASTRYYSAFPAIPK